MNAWTTDYLVLWLRAFLLTQVIEIPIYMRIARCSFWQAFGASGITHPVLWFAIFSFLPLPYLWLCVVGELWAWLGEAAYLKWVVKTEPRLSRAVLWSLIANASSAGLGELCRWLIGYP